MSRELVSANEVADLARADIPPLRKPTEPLNAFERVSGALRELWPSVASLQRAQCTVRARQVVSRPGEALAGVPVLTEGWAACVTRLPDGRRQILSFLLPGDLVSASAVFTERLPFFVEAITAVQCSYYDREAVTAKLAAEPRIFNALVKSLLNEKDQANQLAVDLGRRSASERVARLILRLKLRLEEQNLVAENAFDMPLRQQHVADATGLTSVHVNRVFCAFRREGIIETLDGRLKITDLPALQRKADLA